MKQIHAHDVTCGEVQLSFLKASKMASGVRPGGSVAKNPCANAGDPGSVLGWERAPGEGTGNPLQ